MENVTTAAETTDILDGPGGMNAVYATFTEIINVLSPVLTDETEMVSSDAMVSNEDSTISSTTGIFVEGVHPPVFPPSPLYPFILKAIFLGLILVITIIGNMLVLVSFATTRKLQTYTNYYLVGLAVADLVSGGITPALLNVTFMIGYWPFGPVICRVFIYLNMTFVHATFLLTFIICVDRYRATNTPLRHLREKNKKHALKMVLPGFLVPALLWAAVILVLPEYGVFTPLPPYTCHIPYASNKLFLLVSSLFISWIPIFGTSILYAFIYFKIIRKRPAMRSKFPKKRNSASVVDNDLGSVLELSKEPRSLVNGESVCQTTEKAESTDDDRPTENGAETERRTDRVNEETGDKQRVTAAKDGLSRKKTPAARSHHHQKRLTSSRRATRTLAYIILVMVISGTPWFFYSVVATLARFPPDPFVIWFVGYVTHLSSATNPFLYAICNPVFKEAFLRLLCRWCRKKK